MTDDVIGKQDGKRQQRKPKEDAFTPERRQKFLDALALTCNVKRSAKHAGVDHSTVYYNRVRDQVFAQQWSEALTAGYDRLEALVMEHGGAGERLEDADPDRAAATDDTLPPFDFDKAMRVLQRYDKQRAGGPRQEGGRIGNPSRDETNATLMKALAAAQRRVERAGDDQ